MDFIIGNRKSFLEVVSDHNRTWKVFGSLLSFLLNEPIERMFSVSTTEFVALHPWVVLELANGSEVGLVLITEDLSVKKGFWEQIVKLGVFIKDRWDIDVVCIKRDFKGPLPVTQKTVLVSLSGAADRSFILACNSPDAEIRLYEPCVKGSILEVIGTLKVYLQLTWFPRGSFSIPLDNLKFECFS